MSVAVGCFVYPNFLQAFSGCSDILLVPHFLIGFSRFICSRLLGERPQHPAVGIGCPLVSLLLCFWWRTVVSDLRRQSSEKSKVS
jgi:hypothetical protein